MPSCPSEAPHPRPLCVTTFPSRGHTLRADTCPFVWAVHPECLSQYVFIDLVEWPSKRTGDVYSHRGGTEGAAFPHNFDYRQALSFLLVCCVKMVFCFHLYFSNL